MAENLKPVCDSAFLSFSCELGLGELGTQKKTISDKEEDFPDRGERSDCFLVDIESFSHGNDKDITPNSNIILQRSLSRKGSQRGERTPRDTHTASAGAGDWKSKGTLIGGGTLDKSVNVQLVSVGTTEAISTEAQQTITITAENRCRRYGKQRSSGWMMDPRRILFFFATLSSMGTIILIYFTLSITKFNGEENSHSQ